MPDPTRTTTDQLDGPRALDVLALLDDQLGAVDPDARALVALTRGDDGSIALTDVQLREDGVLEIPAETLGVVVVTSEDVHLDDSDEVVALRQLVAVLPDGVEVGIVRVGDDPTPRTWNTQADGDAMRPRDLTANTARRALGLPSLADIPPVEDLLARSWLARAAQAGLARFDGPEGPREIEPDELSDLEQVDPLPGLADPESDLPSWEQLRAAAADGDLRLGDLTVEPAHAAWLDAVGFAQVVDRTLPSSDQLLATLRIVGDEPLVSWAIDHITERGWELPR